MDLLFVKSNQMQSIGRSVFTILDLFGLLGGVLEILSIAGGLFVAVFADRLVNYTILSNLYHVDTTEYQTDHHNEFSNDCKITPFSYSDHHRSRESRLDENKENYEAENHDENLAISPIHNKRNQYKDSLIDKAKTNIMNRRQYNYKASDWCYNLLCLCKLKRF